jgi:bifunctional non-homologous end joining protein LigD
MRLLPLGDRKAKRARLLARAPRALVLRHACKLELEGMCRSGSARPIGRGPSRDWIKVKNPDSPAMVRDREGNW